MIVECKGDADWSTVVAGCAWRETRAAQEIYTNRHPGSYWVSFGGFSMHDLAEHPDCGWIRPGRNCSASGLPGSSPGSSCSFTEPIAKHMNEHHAEELIAMVRHPSHFPAARAHIVGVDALGMDVRASQEGNDEIVGLRLAFLEPATDRRSVRERIIQMAHSVPS